MTYGKLSLWKRKRLLYTVTHSAEIASPGCFIQEKDFGILKKDKHGKENIFLLEKHQLPGMKINEVPYMIQHE